MNGQEFIEKLKMYGAWCTECHDIHGEKDRYVKVAKVRELLEQIDEPQAEKVEVSQEFADWVEKAKTVKDGLDYKNWCVKEIATIGWGNWLHDPERILDGKVIYDEWVNAVADNKEKHLKAIYDGYAIQPKRWVVRTSSAYFEQFSGDSNHPFNFDATHNICVALTFTDKSKAEAVATLVEGSVEEV